MVMSDALFTFCWRFIPVALEMARPFGRNGDAVEPLRGVRRASGPDEKDQHQNTHEGREPLHHEAGSKTSLQMEIGLPFRAVLASLKCPLSTQADISGLGPLTTHSCH